MKMLHIALSQDLNIYMDSCCQNDQIIFKIVCMCLLNQ